MNFDKISVI